MVPGEVVFGDREGVYFIPPQFVEEILDRAEATRTHDEWTKVKLGTGKYKSSEIYGSPMDPALKQELRGLPQATPRQEISPMRSEPFALILYRRFMDGETVQQLAAGLSIPEDRVGQRLRAAAEFCARRKAQGDLVALGAHLDHAGRERPA